MIQTPKQIARSKRNEAIKKDYLAEVGDELPGARKTGSWAAIDMLSKKHGVTAASVYRIIKSK